MKRTAIYLPLAVILAPLLLPGAALAQGTPVTETGTAPEAGGLGEIVVTATKRESTAQKTPVAISVFTPAKLAETGATDLRALQNLAPTLQIAQSGGSTLVTIRGVSSRDFTEIGDPAVAISIDNFYIQRAVALNAALFDVERVEVLRGPQGTLYGRNATAGAINISSVKPVLGEFKGNGSIEVGAYQTVRAEAGVNIPVGDKVAFRASAFESRHDGYSNNVNVPAGDDDDTQAARLTALFQPVERLKLQLTGEYTHTGGVGPVTDGVPYVTVNGAVSHAFPTIPSRDTFALNSASSYEVGTKSVRGEISYDADFMKITYYGGWRKFIYHRRNDNDGGTRLYRGFPQNENEDTQNHELRFTSNGSGPFTWQAGLYYFKEKNILLSQYADTSTIPQTDLYYFSYNVAAESKAAFVQLGYKITDKLQIEGGIRYNDDKKSRVGYNIINGVRTTQSSAASNHKVTWHAGLNYQITPANLLYAKVDSGYKAGGFTDLAAYGPEKITAYEVGSKNRFLDNMLQANLSGFYYDWTGLQVSQVRADGRSLILNAGKARLYGAEFELVAKPSVADQFDASISYLHGRYTDFAVAVSGVNVSYNGKVLPQAPDWSFGAGYQHVFDLGHGTLTPRIQSRYQTKSYFTYRNYGSEEERAYHKTDLMLTYDSGDTWSVMGFVRNIEDRRTITAAAESGLSSAYVYQFSEPRTYGARVSYKF